jgi:hypothetical protein
MVERRTELNRLYQRKRKMKKLKAKLAAGSGDREKLLYKIKRLSPWWTEDSIKQPGETKASDQPKSEAPKRKAPAKKKTEKPT